MARQSVSDILEDLDAEILLLMIKRGRLEEELTKAAGMGNFTLAHTRQTEVVILNEIIHKLRQFIRVRK